MLTQSKNCYLVAGPDKNLEPLSPITYTKLYVPVVTSSTEGNVKLLKQLESSFKRTVRWNKYQSKITDEAQH